MESLGLTGDCLDYIYEKLHNSLQQPVNESINCFKKSRLISANRESYRYFHWVELLCQVRTFEDSLLLAINSGCYTSLLHNTNIPIIVYKKYHGDNFEESVKINLIKRKRLPDSLRKYLLYDRKNMRNIRLYHMKAGSNEDVICGFLKSFPGGVSAWQYYYEIDKSYDQCNLADLAKHQWAFLDYDLFFYRIKNFKTVSKKFKMLEKIRYDALY
tara:strand:- start:5165 stop:5806 length:642 start_codon:yes stop_codon:yes gene_type:complete